MHIPRMEQPKTTLAKWMAETGRTDHEIAVAISERIGKPFGRAQVCKLRNGNSDPSFRTAQALEAITSIPAIALFAPPRDAAA
jgi:hypothetical protein